MVYNRNAAEWSDFYLIGVLEPVLDPFVQYGIYEAASRLGLDIKRISRNRMNELQPNQIDALVMPEIRSVDDWSVSEFVNATEHSIILVGPHAFPSIDRMFGVEQLGVHDSFPDVSGYLKSTQLPHSVPIFYALPLFRLTDPSAIVLAKAETNGECYPSVVLRREDRRCLARIGPQMFRSIAHLLTISGMRPNHGDRTSYDSYGRIRLESTAVHRWGYLHQPVVDYYVRILEALLIEITSSKSVPLIQKWVVPGPERFCVCLSHDVDHLTPPPRDVPLSVIGALTSPKLRQILARTILTFFYFLSGVLTHNRDLLAAMPSSVHKALEKYESYWRLEQITLCETRLGVRSTFFFLSNEGRSRVGSNYDLGNSVVFNAIRQLSKKGFEISSHCTFGAADNATSLEVQKKKLENALCGSVVGVRAHYLGFSYPRSFWNFVKAGYAYDSSIMFSEEVGYRASTCFPWTVFDVETNTMIRLVEFAPTIMDRTLVDMRLSPDLARKVCLDLLEQIADLHGVLTVIWHNSGVGVRPDEDNAWWQVYWALIREALWRGGRFMTLRDLFAYYRVRDATSVVSKKTRDDSCEVVLNCEQEYPSFALCVNSKHEIVGELLNGRPLPQASTTKMGQSRFIVTLPLTKGHNILSLKICDSGLDSASE